MSTLECNLLCVDGEHGESLMSGASIVGGCADGDIRADGDTIYICTASIDSQACSYLYMLINMFNIKPWTRPVRIYGQGLSELWVKNGQGLSEHMDNACQNFGSRDAG